MSLINTVIKPFKATAFHNGAFVDVSDADLRGPLAVVMALFAPNILIDNRASNRFTVIEANARDRPALLYDLAFALFEARVTIHSAHIATYGERAVDTFYATDLFGAKIESKTKLKSLETRLLEAASVRARVKTKAA